MIEREAMHTVSGGINMYNLQSGKLERLETAQDLLLSETGSHCHTKPYSAMGGANKVLAGKFQLNLVCIEHDRHRMASSAY